MACAVTQTPLSAVTRVAGAGGLRICVESWGSPDRPGVVFAHGFGQTRQAWASTAAAIAAAGFHCVAFDARGHGDSDWRGDAPYAWEQMVDDLLAVAHVAGEAPVLVGASMGGLIGLATAGTHADAFRALVLVDVTPRWEAAGVDRILAFMRAHPEGFESLDAAASAIAAYLPHRREKKSPDRLRALLDDRGDGRLRWHWDPRLIDEIAADSERHQPRLIEAARSLRVPVLLVSGSESDIVSRSTIDEFLALVPQARHVVVQHATHMVAGDDNAVFTRHVLQFLHTLQDEELSR